VKRRIENMCFFRSYPEDDEASIYNSVTVLYNTLTIPFTKRGQRRFVRGDEMHAV